MIEKLPSTSDQHLRTGLWALILTMELAGDQEAIKFSPRQDSVFGVAGSFDTNSRRGDVPHLNQGVDYTRQTKIVTSQGQPRATSTAHSLMAARAARLFDRVRGQLSAVR